MIRYQQGFWVFTINYPKITCIYNNNSWFIYKNIVESIPEYSNNEELTNILTVDCDFNIYKPYLKPITKYKLKDLVEICKSDQFNIDALNRKVEKYFLCYPQSIIQ